VPGPLHTKASPRSPGAEPLAFPVSARRHLDVQQPSVLLGLGNVRIARTAAGLVAKDGELDRTAGVVFDEIGMQESGIPQSATTLLRVKHPCGVRHHRHSDRGRSFSQARPVFGWPSPLLPGFRHVQQEQFQRVIDRDGVVEAPSIRRRGRHHLVQRKCYRTGGVFHIGQPCIE
jgi:hypothetical protein